AWCDTRTPATARPSRPPSEKDCEFRCVRNANADPPYDAGAPRDRGARRLTVTNPRAARRLRIRTHDAASPAARTPRAHVGAAHRRRAHGDDAGTVPARDHGGLAV